MFGRPISEARPKSVNRVARSKLDKQVQHLTLMTGEQLAVAASKERKRARGKRNVMLPSLRHSFGWDNPGFTINEVIWQLS